MKISQQGRRNEYTNYVNILNIKIFTLLIILEAIHVCERITKD